MLESVEGFVVFGVTDKEIHAIIAKFEGDPRAAIRRRLHDFYACGRFESRCVAGLRSGTAIAVPPGRRLAGKEVICGVSLIRPTCVLGVLQRAVRRHVAKFADSNSKGWFGIGGVNATLFKPY